MRTGSAKLDRLFKDHGSRIEIQSGKKHWVVKVDGKTVIVLSHGPGRNTKYRTMKNSEARLVRALREAGVDV